MPSVHDVAGYLLRLADRDRTGIDHLKLQKLVYYTQAFHLGSEGTPLFPDRLHAWRYGPVSPDLWSRYRYRRGYIAPPADPVGLSLSDRERDLVELVYERFRDLSGPDLVRRTHGEANGGRPWSVRAMVAAKSSPKSRCAPTSGIGSTSWPRRVSSRPSSMWSISARLRMSQPRSSPVLRRTLVNPWKPFASGTAESSSLIERTRGTNGDTRTSAPHVPSQPCSAPDVPLRGAPMRPIMLAALSIAHCDPARGDDILISAFSSPRPDRAAIG